MKPSDTENAKQQLSQILDTMQGHAADSQCVYSCLVQLHDLLDSHTQIQLLVDALLSRETTVKVLQGLMHIHLSQEEIQWYWCRVLTLACNASLRFQCQVGRLALWSDVYELRSAHPASSRVLLTSLYAYEALLRNNEHHVLQAKPAQKLIHEMLHTIDRFAQIQYQNKSMVVAAMHVLVAIYASPRLQSLVEDKKALSFAPGDAIVSRLVFTVAIFLEKPSDTSLWLQMCRLQLQHHTSSAVSGLFLGKIEDDKNIKPWFVLLVEKCDADVAIMYEYAALFTYMFAVPDKVVHVDKLDALAHDLLKRHDLLRYFCNVLDKVYQSRTHEPQDNSRSAGTTASPSSRTILEIIRTIRQWSSVDAMLRHFAKSLLPVKAVVLRVLIPMLEQISSTGSSVISTSWNLQSALEILLLFQRLWTLKEYRNVLQASGPLQSATHHLHKTLDTEVLSQVSTVSKTKNRDSDLDYLVQRELVKLMALMNRPVPSASSTLSSQKQLIKTSTSSSRLPTTTQLPHQNSVKSVHKLSTTTTRLRSRDRNAPPSSAIVTNAQRALASSSQRR